MESSISGWAGRLREYVFTTERAYLFVTKGPAAKVWHFIWQGGSWQKAAESTALGDAVYAAGEQEDGTLTEMASQAAMEIAKKGWQDLPVVYVVPDSPFDINVKRLDMLLQLLEQAYGVKPLIMANQQAYLKYFSLERYASYHVLIVSNGLRFPDTRYTIWQYTDKEKVAGILEYVPGLKLHPTYNLKKLKMN